MCRAFGPLGLVLVVAVAIAVATWSGSCGRTELDAASPSLPRCGDGVVDPGEACDDGNRIDDDGCDNACRLPVCGDGKRAGREECDLGPDNGGHRPAFLISQASGTRIATDPLVRAQNVIDFYDYSSFSSHTGLEQVSESRIYLYVAADSGRLSLVMTHGIDYDTTAMEQPPSIVEMDVAGLPPGFTVELSDDPADAAHEPEFQATGPDTAAGRWGFSANSDGGVVGDLPFPGTWKITVTPRFEMGLATWGWVRNDGERIPLVMTEPITIEAFDESTACRKTCVVPRCGDGILDGSEVCDDGNTRDGDGCASNCRRLR